MLPVALVLGIFFLRQTSEFRKQKLETEVTGAGYRAEQSRLLQKLNAAKKVAGTKLINAQEKWAYVATILRTSMTANSREAKLQMCVAFEAA